MTIRNIDENLKRRLRQRAAANDRSMEEEARAILNAALPAPDSFDLYSRLRSRVEPYGGFDLAEREPEPIGPAMALNE